MQPNMMRIPGLPLLPYGNLPMFPQNGIGVPMMLNNGFPHFQMPHPAEMLRSHPLPPGESSSTHRRTHSDRQRMPEDHRLPLPPGELRGHHRSSSYGGRYSGSDLKRNHDDDDRRRSSDYYPEEKRSRFSSSHSHDIDERRSHGDDRSYRRQEYRERSRSYASNEPHSSRTYDQDRRHNQRDRERDKDERELLHVRQKSNHRFL